MKTKKQKKITIWTYILKSKKTIIATLFLLFFAVCLGRLVTYLNTFLVDKAIVPQNYTVFLGIGGTIVGLLLIEGVCFYFQNNIFCNLGLQIATQIRKDLYEKIMYAPFDYFEKHEAAGILSRSATYINDLCDFVCNNLVPFMFNLLKFVTVFIFMFALNGLLGFIIFAVLLFIIGIVMLIAKLSSKRNKVYKKLEIEREAGAMENAFGLSSIIDNGGQNIKAKEFDKVQQDALIAWNKFSNINSLFLPIAEGLWFLGIVIVYVFSFSKLGTIGFDLGAIISFISYITQTNEPIKQVLLNYQYFINIFGAINKIFDIIQIDTSQRGKRTMQIVSPSPDLEVKDLCFKHEQKGIEIKNLNASVKYGEKIAFVGDSGKGKTTLAYLLARIYKPISGNVLIDNKDSWLIEKGNFESNVYLTPSEFSFFEETIRANLTLGNQDVSDELVMYYLDKVGLTNKISKLQNGLSTKLRNNADIFTSFEKQLLIIVRMMIRDPKIIIFDGFFDLMSGKEKKKIFKIINEYAINKTVIFLCEPKSELPFDCKTIKL